MCSVNKKKLYFASGFLLLTQLKRVASQVLSSSEFEGDDYVILIAVRLDRVLLSVDVEQLNVDGVKLSINSVSVHKVFRFVKGNILGEDKTSHGDSVQ